MPNRSAHTQTGNFRARYAAEFDDPTGVEYRIEFIDNDTSTSARVAFGQTSAETPHEIPVTADGFVLSYDGPTDHIGAAIIPSKCTARFIVENSNHELLTPEIRDGDDGRFGLAIYKSDGVDWVPFWVGGLNHEAIEYELQDQRFLVTLSASCGLNRLRDIAFRKDDGSAYTDKETIASLVAICLNKIPFANFWLNADNQLAEVVDIFNDEGQTGWSPSAGDPFPFSVAERTLTFASGFYEVNDPEKDIYNRRIYRGPNFMTCMDVLESVSVAFGYRIFQSETLFWLFPANAYNWSHTLRVHKWTRSQVATESIELAIPGGGTTFDETSTTTDVNFRVDLDTNHGLVNGFAHSYLIPVHECVITHLNGGRQSAFGAPFTQAIEVPTAGPQVFTSADTVLQDGEYLTVRGNYFSQPLLTQFGIGEPTETDRIGARIVLRFKIKAGSYYYGSEYSVDTETTNIDMPFGFTDLSFKRLFLDTAEWSTDEKFFDVIVPWTNSSPAADVESSQGWDRVGGLHIDATGNAEFKYRANTQWGSVSHPIDFTTAPLPDVVSTYTGIEIELDRIVVTRAGVALDHYDHLMNVFGMGVSVAYDQDGAAVSPNTTAPADLITDFQLLIGGADEDSDIVYTASQTNQIESFDMGQTLLGDSNIDGEASTRGCFFILQPGQTERTSQNLSNFDWQSITDSVDQNDTADGLLEVRARETLFARSKPRPTQRGEIAISYNATNVAPLHMTNVWHHNCSTVGNVIEYLVPFRFEWNAGFGTFNADLCLIRRQRVGFVNETDKIVKNPPIDTDGGIGPGDTSGDTGLSKVLQVVENVYNDHESELSNLDTRITSNDADITGITQRLEFAIPTDYKTTPKIQVSSKNTSTSSGTIGATSNGVFLTAANDMSSTLSLELPSADGTSGQALTTDGSGVLSFTTISGGGGGGSSDVYAFLECSSNIGMARQFRFLPIGGNYVDTGGVGSLGAQNGAIVYNTFVFPFDGELDRVVLRCENAPGTINVRVLKNGTSTYSGTASQSSDDTAEIITFSSATFSAGDGINISCQFSAVPADVFAVVVLKMTP